MATIDPSDLQSRHRLVLPLFRPNLDVGFKGWMGGATYLENLARVLSLLPEHIRPRILVLTDGAVDTPVVRALFKHAAVEGVFAPDGAPLALKPALFARLIDGVTPNRARIEAMLSQPSAVFPVFRTMYRPENALHWIPDFQHKHLPQMFDADERARRDEDFAAMAMNRNYLLLSSRAAERDLAQFYPNATRARICVAFCQRPRSGDGGARRSAPKIPAAGEIPAGTQSVLEAQKSHDGLRGGPAA